VPVQVYQVTGSTLLVGLLSASEFALILLLAFVGGAYAASVDKRKMLRLTEIGQTLVMIFFGFSTKSIFSFILSSAGRGFDMISGVFRMTIWSQTIPHYLRGRLARLEMISYTSGPKLGDAEAGIVPTLFSVRTSIVSGGILCVVGTAVISALIPQFIRYHGSEGIKQKDIEEAMRETETKSLLVE